MNKIFYKNSVLTFFLFCITGCANQVQRFTPKNYFLSKLNGFCQAQDGVTVFIKALNSLESVEYFNVDLNSYGYIPIYIKVKNKSNDSHIIHPSYIDLQPTDPSVVAKKLHFNTSLFVSTATCLSLLFWWPAAIIVGHEGYKMANYNKHADASLKSMTLQNETINLLPHQNFETFIFVDKTNFKSPFNLKVFNTDQKKLLKFEVIPFNNPI